MVNQKKTRCGLFAFLRKSALMWVAMFSLMFLLNSCYHRHSAKTQHAALVEYSDKQLDSISFSTTHHYTNKYNFVVAADSLVLIKQQPEEYVNHLPIDSFAAQKNCLLVVSDIRMIPQDSIDSVWVQLATEDNAFGWIHESSLLPKVVPDDPISQFIMVFSNTHLLIFLIVIVLIGVAYLVKKVCTRNAKIVHFNDIDSPYPTALVLTVSLSAAFYATIQMFMPEMWRQFYFHPTLNPFAVPRVLGFFLASVWAILILGLACLDEVKHRLSLGEATLYMGGLMGVCALDYIVFSVGTLYYIGYLLLLAYFWYSIRAYLKRNR